MICIEIECRGGPSICGYRTTGQACDLGHTRSGDALLCVPCWSSAWNKALLVALALVVAAVVTGLIRKTILSEGKPPPAYTHQLSHSDND